MVTGYRPIGYGFPIWCERSPVVPEKLGSLEVVEYEAMPEFTDPDVERNDILVERR